MKKIITIIVAILALTSAYAQNQQIYNPSATRFELRVEHGISYQANYISEYYESMRTEVTGRGLLGPIFAALGVGFDWSHPRINEKAVYIAGQVGYKFAMNRFDFDIYASMEKSLYKEHPKPPVGGLGMSFSYNIIKRLYATADIRTQYQFFQSSYFIYKRTLNGMIALGIAMKF